MVIGTLALQVAANSGGRVTGMRGALTTVLGQPFGRALLLVVVAGLLGYAAWRILQGLFDPDRLGKHWRGLEPGDYQEQLFYPRRAAQDPASMWIRTLALKISRDLDRAKRA